MAVPVFQAWGSYLATLTSGAPGAPASVAQGDLLLLVVEDQATDASSPVSVSGGTETWTQLPNSPQFSSGATRLTVYWARASQASPTMPTVGIGVNHVFARVARFTGVKSSGNPWNGSEYNQGSNAAADATIPGFSTGGADRLIVDLCSTGYNGTNAARFSAWANSSLASPAITEIHDQTDTIGGGGGFGASNGGMASSGTVGNTTVTEAFSGHGYIKVALSAAVDPQTVTGAALSVTPSLPVAEVQQAGQSITGAALSVSPSEPTGRLDHSVIAVVLTVTPTEPVGRLDHALQALVFTVTPTLPSGDAVLNVLGAVLSVTPTLPSGRADQALTGAALSTTPSAPTGWLQVHPVGVVLSVTPSLPIGDVAEAGSQQLTGVALTANRQTPVGALLYRVLGVAFTVTPSLPAGGVTQVLSGAVLTVAPALPVAHFDLNLGGLVLSTTPSLPVGTVSGAGVPQQVDGVALSLTPTLPAGTGYLGDVLTGVPLVVMPDDAFYDDPDVFYDDENYTYEGQYVGYAPVGRLDHAIVGQALSVTPSMPAGTVAEWFGALGTPLLVFPSLPVGSVSPVISGVVLVIVPTMPTGGVGHITKGLIDVEVTVYNRAIGGVTVVNRAVVNIRKLPNRAMAEVT